VWRNVGPVKSMSYTQVNMFDSSNTHHVQGVETMFETDSSTQAIVHAG
jgi:hypothetical protein